METKEILEKVRSGEMSVEEAEGFFRRKPFEDLGYAKLDSHRRIRSGAAEVVFCQGKDDSHLAGIFERIYDVGISGLHRLLSHVDRIQQANCVIAVAGMEGALASVIGGLVDKPVIAVPTSVGYGASFQGLSALLTMVNSCSNGVATVNIDNGFGAGYIASQINLAICGTDRNQQ